MNQDFLIFLSIIIAGVVTVSSQPGRLSLWETIIGFILSVLLFCINRAGFNTFSEKLVFCAVAGLCLTITIGFFIEYLLDIWPYFDIPKEGEESRRRNFAFFCLWIFLSFITFFLFLY